MKPGDSWQPEALVCSKSRRWGQVGQEEPLGLPGPLHRSQLPTEAHS